MEFWPSSDGKSCNRFSPADWFQADPWSSRSILAYLAGRVSERASSRFTKNGPLGRVRIVSVLEGANKQTGSLFFTRLPLEVRSMVYSHLLCLWARHQPGCSGTPFSDVRSIHVRESTSYGRCLWGEPCYVEDGIETCQSWRNCASQRCLCATTHHRLVGVHVLVFTCRMLYHEYLPRMYEHYRFLIPSVHIWETFALGMIQHQQFTHGALQSLQNIHLDVGALCALGRPQWTKLRSCFKLLASRAVSLAQLYISIIPVEGRECSTFLGRELLRDLASLRGLDTFQLEIVAPWRLRRYWNRHRATGLMLTKEWFERRTAAIQRVLRAIVTLPRGAKITRRKLDAMLSVEALAAAEED